MKAARPRPGGSARGGFTLIELMAVVLIIGMLMTTFTVRLDALLPATRGEEAGRMIIGTLDQARLAAISYGREYAVQFDLDGNRYRSLSPFDEEGRLARDPEDRQAAPWQELPSGVRIAAIFDHNEEITDSGVYEIRFHSLGGADEIYLQLVNDAAEGAALTVHLQALTGQARVLRGAWEPVPVTEDDL